MLKEYIREIFTSIQGEGPYVGTKQVFVRFCGCNLQCKYCDTETDIAKAKEYDTNTLANIINNEKNIHSIALTGGEPLLHAEYLSELLPQINSKIYLESNATMPDELAKIIQYIDIISADIKLKSASGMDTFAQHEKFFKLCKKYNKEIFAKVVFNPTITDAEIKDIIQLCKKYDIELILQPEMSNNKLNMTSKEIEEIFNKIAEQYNNIRLIPQTHKFLNLQ